MTTAQYKAALKRAGLSQMAFARLVEADGRTMRRWIKEATMPKAQRVLLHFIAKGTITLKDVEKAK